MTAQTLLSVPARSDIFIDANIFIYALNGKSRQCADFLERCSREEITGVSLFLVVNEATHCFMLAEAVARGMIAKGRAKDLKARRELIPALTDYWRQTEKILALNILLLETDEAVIRRAQQERDAGQLLTNDSLIVSCMHEYGIRSLASNDGDFECVAGITVFQPSDV